jgi:hypothetical protein
MVGLSSPHDSDGYSGEARAEDPMGRASSVTMVKVTAVGEKHPRSEALSPLRLGLMQ